MPAIKITKVSDQLLWGIWKIDESAEELMDMLRTGSSEEMHDLMSIKVPQKQIESLGARIMLKTLLAEVDESYAGIWKDEHSKPHLLNSSTQISFSHCFPYATAVIDLEKPVGIDIERERDKLIKVRSKYLTENEIAFAGEKLDLLCKYWSAKEAVYKANGRKAVSLRDQISLELERFDKAVLHDHGVSEYGLAEYFFDGYHVVFTC